MTVRELRNYVEQQKGHRNQITKQINELNERLRDNAKSLRRHEQAREIIRVVGLRTQEQLQYHIGDVTSLALEAVYDNPYQLVAEFVQRRNKTECDLYFHRDGERIDPMDAAGGGTVNVAAFALRAASWSMQRPRTNNVIILDEPFGQLSQDHQEKASEMIKQVSKKLGIQIIMVTHSDELVLSADKTFHVSIHKGVSKVVVD